MNEKSVPSSHWAWHLLGFALVVGGAVWAAALAVFATTFPAAVVSAIFALIAVFVLSGFARQYQGLPFGAANSITFFRASLIAFVGGFAAEPPMAGAPVWWIAAATAGIALLLDGVDGWVARRTERTTAFGARFDMEIDALAALILCVVLWRADLSGVWVILIGGMRYAFIAAGWLLPWMRRPLPPRQRRRVVCAIQGFLLVSCLVPILPTTVPSLLAGGALAATGASFLADTVWLIRRRREPV